MSEQRNSLSLNGEWDFQFNGIELGKITVPLAWECDYPQLREKAGTGVYERTFTAPSPWKGRSVRLQFGASEYYTEVSVNGQIAGTHEGGYTPFDFDITELLTGYGTSHEHTVTVSVTDSTNKEDALLPNSETLAFAEIPHGKQSWYSSIGGLWQGVSLVAHAPTYIEHATLVGDVDTETVSLRVQFRGIREEFNEDWELRYTVHTPSQSEPVVNRVLPFLPEPNEEGCSRLRSSFALENPLLWSPDSPHLYTATLTLLHEHRAVDSVTTRFGMRKIETRDGWVWLNDKPLFLVGVLDQDFYPNTLYTPPSREYLRDQFEKAKSLGINLMRCHIKVPDPVYLELCDEMGLLVWYEIPNGKKLTSAFRKRARDTFSAMWVRDANHPSICFASIMNESWGIDLNNPDERDWLRDTYYWAKSIASIWLIVDNSPCIPNFHVATDLDDFHIYFNIPDHADKYAEFIERFAKREYPTWSPYDDAEKRGKEPLILSEFGNWGLQALEPLFEAEGGEPYWFTTGWDAVVPTGVLERFEEQGLGRVFKNYADLAEAAQWQEYLSLKWEIEEMRRYSSIAGYVITEFTDLNWECNGLLDFNRQPKTFHNVIPSVFAQDILIPRMKRTALFSDEAVEVEVSLSSFSGQHSEAKELRWRIAGEGAKAAGSQYPANLSGVLGSVALNLLPIKTGSQYLTNLSGILPEVSTPVKANLEISLLSETGDTVAQTTQNIVIVPASRRQIGKGTRLCTPCSAEVFNALASVGFEVSSKPIEGVIAVFTHWDEIAQSYIEGGGRAILLVSEPDDLPADNALQLQVESRDKDGRWGDWCGGKTWLVPSVFSSLPDTRIYDFEYQPLISEYVLLGAEAEETFAGIYIGWLRSPGAFLVRKTYGAGSVVVTTFVLHTTLGVDPIPGLVLSDALKLL